eukprot:UN01178
MEMDRLQDIIKKLQSQLISMQQEINKSHQEKESLKKQQCEEKDELLRTISQQDAYINNLEAEN